MYRTLPSSQTLRTKLDSAKKAVNYLYWVD